MTNRSGRRLQGLAIIGLGLIASAAFAAKLWAGSGLVDDVGPAGKVANGPRDAAPVVYLAPEGLSVHVPFSWAKGQDAGRVYVRILGPDGRVWRDSISNGASFQWPPRGPDGLYRYEAFALPEPAPVSEHLEGDDPNRLERASQPKIFGHFRVKAGLILSPAGAELTSRSNASPGLLESTLGAALQVLVPEAVAADVYIDDQFPMIIFDDSDDEDCSANGDFFISANGGTSVNEELNSFKISAAAEDLGDGCPTVIPNLINIVYSGEPIGSENSSVDSIVAYSNGDMEFANGDLSIDRSEANVGIGTTTPGEDLHIIDTRPTVLLEDSSDSSQASVRHDFGLLVLEGDGGVNVVSLSTSAPATSLKVDGNGNVGLGVSSPTAPLHLQRNNGNSRILVEESSVLVGTRRLLELVNAGPVEISMANTAGNTWVLSTADGGFSVRKGTSSTAKLAVRSNGDLESSGTLTEGSSREIKERITRIDHGTVLRKLVSLPISEWNYIDDPDDRHVGPMAEDFHAAFGLGPDTKHIAPKDLAGVALAGIKALKKENNSLRQQVESSARQREALSKKMAVIEARLREMEKRLGR